jgi:hypothetical protein
MATLVWNDEHIIEAMLKYHKINGKWPKSRDWWFANKGRWPSFTTVCNRPLRWSGLLKIAKERFHGENQSLIS